MLKRHPVWLNKKINFNKTTQMQALLKKFDLNTVCQSAACPNIGECFADSEVTFMILGKHCSRNCSFCNIDHLEPESVDYNESCRIAEAVGELRLKHVVITSVTRDDLPDGGAEVFTDTVRNIKERSPDVTVEVLIPDFNLNRESLKIVIDSKPDIIAHNLETVDRLYQEVRPQADYRRSLEVLDIVKKKDRDIFTKSGLMLGLGEKEEEILKAFDDLRAIACDFLSIGQYLAPTLKHYPISDYVEPKKFREYKEQAISRGFSYVMSAPYVRSSYRAGEYLKEMVKF
ncbi:MAG: lipoyl synthase [Candidatus Kaelpia aquatica]|nr:lipoyl synthase [Candidatus Kaelpia aquatica]